MSEDILFEQKGGIGLVTVNRPKALNALTRDMCVLMRLNLERWAHDPSIRAVVVQGAGEKAFCAGGDIVTLYNAGKAGEAGWENFFADEYRMNATIGYFPKPYIALVDGIAMGGGVGISVHGSHRVATERMLFAMPETGIGLVPDVGGGYFMPRLKGEAGMFLALTGTRLKAADCVAFGIATHFVPSDRLAALIDALAEADLADNAAVDAVIADFVGDPGPAQVIEHQPQIDRHFAAPSVEAIIAALDGDDDPWAQEIAKIMRRMSPTSMKLTYRQMREGRSLGLKDALKLEYRLVSAIKDGHDFFEGVRAQLIEKDRNPQWRPADLAAVTPDMIARYFQAPAWGDLDFA